MAMGIQFGMNFRSATRQFFDTKKIERAVKRGIRNSLSYFASYTRKAAQWSIKKRNKPSEPGQPPSSHTGVLKDFIFYWLDKTQGVALIGPVVTSKSPYGEITVPQILEEGGTVVRAVKGKNELEVITIAARPYMGPAFEKAKAKLPNIWKDSIRP